MFNSEFQMHISVRSMSVSVSVLRLSMLGALTLPLQCVDYESCKDEIKVHRYTTYEATLGQPLSIVCPVRFCDGSIPTISWFKLETDFVKLNFSDRVRTEWTAHNHEGESFLIFNNVQSSDSGLYRCRFGIVVSHLINVTLKDLDCDIELKVHRHTTYVTSVGQELRIACPVHFCNDTPTVSWLKLETGEFTRVISSDRVTTEWTVINDHEGISFLNFYNVLSRDSGLYHCRSGIYVSHMISVSVACGTDVHHNTVYVAAIGDLVKITCPVYHFPPTVTWFKQGRRLKQDDRVTTEWERLNNSDGLSSLIFQNVLSTDSGQYQCKSGSHVRHTLILSIVCGIDVPHSYNSTAGDLLKIACPVCDNVPSTVTWFKNETQGLVRVNMSDRVTTEWTRVNNYEMRSFLIFHKVLSSDSGRYLCNGSSANHTIDVLVIDPIPHSFGWSFLYRSLGLIVFFIIVAGVYVVLNKRKNVAASSALKDSCVTSSGEPRHDSLSVPQSPVYENVL